MSPPSRTMVAAALVVVLTSSGCASSGRSGSSGGSGPPASESTRAGTTTTAPDAWAAASLRGSRLPGVTCPPPSSSGSTPGPEVEVAASAVTEVLVCPVMVPNPGGTTAEPVRLSPSSPGFRPLLLALAAPDQPRPPGQICPLYADVAQPVVAASASGAVLVHIPVDGCGHYQAAARAALSAARRG